MSTQPPNAAGGLVVVDKPAGLTSHDVVARLRRLAGTRRVGHAGTLDPMATGVLVVGVGQGTKLLHHLVLTDKTYAATIRLGHATSTDDAEGDVVAGATAADVDVAAVRAAIVPLTGAIHQVPSTVSAIKVDGRRAYQRVREGETVVLAARPVRVHRFDVLTCARPAPDLLDVEVEVECSSGTYIRALARDLGIALGVGGHLTALRRTRVGPFTIDGAHTLDELGARENPLTLPLPDAVRATMPIREIDATEAGELSYGRPLAPRGIEGVHAALAPDGTVAALLREDGERARPLVVFRAAG